MPHVELDEHTYDLIMFAARAAGVSPGTIVARLVEEMRSVPAATRPERAPAGGEAERPIYAMYRDEEVRAVYHPATRRVRIVSGTLEGRAFRTPSAAAGAVVAAMNPGRQMGRINGLRFWRDAATGARLEAEAQVPERLDEGDDERDGVH